MSSMTFNIGRSHIVQEAPIQKLLSTINIPKDAISFGQGIPFFSPPPESISAATHALSDEAYYRYTEDAGLLSLRRAIAEKISIENGYSADAEENIMVTSGGNQAFMNALMAITNQGDEIIVLEPYYFNHIMALQFVGCKPIIVKTDNNYQPILSELEESFNSKTKAMITISPNNPTGAVYSKEVLSEINNFCDDHSIYHISDEAYEHFVFDDRNHVSPAIFDNDLDHTISIYSFSKSFGMAGYRVGYMVYPSFLHKEVLKVQDTIGICPPGPSQKAAEAAILLGSRYPKSFLSTINKVRQLIKNELDNNELIINPTTHGGFYFFIRFKTKKTSWQVVSELAEQFGVVTIPGEVFGADYPSLRLSFGNLPVADAEVGVKRLIYGLEKIL